MFVLLPGRLYNIRQPSQYFLYFSIMQRITSILFGFLSCLTVANAQLNRDSLQQKLRSAKEDTNKVYLLINMGETYLHSEPQVASSYYRQAGELSAKLGYKFGQYRSLQYTSGSFIVTGNYDSALYYNQQALEVAKAMKDSLSIGISLFNIGIAYREKSEFEHAINYCLQGLKIIEPRNSPAYEVQIMDALQLLYYNRSEYDKALMYGRKALALSRKMPDKVQLIKSLANLSMSLMEINKMDSAYTLLKEAESIAKPLHEPWIDAGIATNLAGCAIQKHNYDEARSYAKRNLEISRQIDDPSGISMGLRTLSICDLQQGNFDNARILADSAIAISRKYGHTRDEVNLLRLLSVIGYARHDLEKALNYDTESNKKLDAMIKDLMSQQSAELEKKYETEKKEAAIKTLEAEKKVQQLSIRQKNTINYILIGCAAVLAVLAALIYLTQKQKQKLQQQRISELETEKQLAATEAVLKGEEQERSRLAKDLHDGLGGILSGIKYSFNTMKSNLHLTPENQYAFERGVEMLDISIKEMRRVAHNMMPEALLKFGLDTALKDFCNDINQSGALRIVYQSIGMEADISKPAAIPVYRIVQELVNNIIKHAEASSAIVQLSRTDNNINITVEDDGNGFDSSALQQTSGIGWSNIRSRVEYLKGNLNIQSAPGKGTSVHVEFPAS